MTTMVSIFCRPSAGAVAQPASARKRIQSNLMSFPQPIRPEPDVADLAALRALSHVLRDLLLVERLERAVLALDAAHHQRVAVGHCDRCKRNVLRKREQLHA